MNEFHDIQLQFTRHLRDPENHPAVAGLEDRRLKIYRDLFFNNIVNFLESGFPVLHSLYPQEQWLVLARTFFASHSCRSPYFVDISKEFVEYLSSEYNAEPTDPAFLLELAHYEWIELAISIRIQETNMRFWNGEETVTNVAFSELAELLSYQFPVHQIGPDFQPSQPGESPTYLVVSRNNSDDVQFIEVNAVTAHLLNTVIEHESLPVADLISQMCVAMPHLTAEQVASGAQITINQMLEKQVLLPACA